ncbi:hypothetical protein PGB90_006362 [Kerria lacca]
MNSNSYSEIERNFLKACQYVQNNHSLLSSNLISDLYKFYKQAVCGKCNVPKPSKFNFNAYNKWKLWSKLGNMSEIEAMQNYVQLLNNRIINWEEDVDSQLNNNSWVVVSSLSAEEDIPESTKDIYDWVKEGQLNKIKSSTEKFSVDIHDNQGMTLLHWAADRGHLNVVQYLVVDMKADMNCCDEENQTPLHYAAACGHLEVCKFLIDFGADVNALDNNNLSPKDIAEDLVVKQLLTVDD